MRITDSALRETIVIATQFEKPGQTVVRGLTLSA